MPAITPLAVTLSSLATSRRMTSNCSTVWRYWLCAATRSSWVSRSSNSGWPGATASPRSAWIRVTMPVIGADTLIRVLPGRSITMAGTVIVRSKSLCSIVTSCRPTFFWACSLSSSQSAPASAASSVAAWSCPAWASSGASCPATRSGPTRGIHQPREQNPPARTTIAAPARTNPKNDRRGVWGSETGTFVATLG